MTTNILKEKKALKERINTYTSYDEQIAIFEWQKESIKKIQWTEWFRNIRNFWLKQEMEAIREFEEVDLEDKLALAEVRAKYKLAKDFNSYITVRLK